MTPYAAAKIVNAVLETLETGKQIPPQMMYNYANKQYIKSTRDGQNKIQIVEDDLQEWLKKYVKKNFDIDLDEQNDNVEDDKIEGQEELDLEGAMN